ncbi:polysaccharide deacetylase family protein [Effusibacillus pohliae]|uniref:polysaccharide deacetylase family protein n=1 Tax=Effusibacillus pohliae TaxID=232270 RepID=UPI00036D5A67|nr:polysaccharide deacetylase family protein [Effusibacillus pohliae]
MRSYVVASLLAAFLGITLQTATGQPAGVQPQAASVQSISREDLQHEAARRYQKPIDAVVSKAGKPNIIPELNGIELDVEATAENMRKMGGRGPECYIYRQILPKVKMSDFPNLPVYQGNPHKQEMALMVNVAWGTEYLDGILQVLRENGVKATFFLDGSWLKKNPDAAKRIVAEGHEIGNHAYTHPDMAALPPAKQAEQIAKTQEEIRKVLGVQSKWFAPPSGSYNETTVKIAREHGMGTVLWTLDTVDWRRPSQAEIIRRIVPNAKNGALVLMHPTEPTLGALRTLVPDLKQKGFQLVTVSELLSPIRKVQ